MDELIKVIKPVFEKYLDEENLQRFLKNEENFNFGYRYWYWFKSTNLLQITEEDLKNSHCYSQKLGLRIIITFSLIESLYGEKFGENVVISFFSNLNLEERFLFSWLIETKDPTREEEVELLLKDEEAGKDHRQLENSERRLKMNLLLSYLLNQNSALMKREFDERIKYLYALRSQIIHQGKLPFFMAKFGSFHEGIIKMAIVSSFPKKNVQDKILIFRDYKHAIKLEDILEDLVFISLFRNKDIKIREKFLKEFKKKFWKVLEMIQKYSYGDLYFSIRQQLNQYLNISRDN